MFLLNKIQDIWYDVFILKHDVENEVTSISENLVLELIKILKWKLPKYTYLETVSKINQYVYQIEIQKKRFNVSAYIRILFEENIENFEIFKDIIKYDLSDFTSYPEVKSDIKSYIKIKELLYLISIKLGNNEEFGDIEDYF